MKDFRSKKKPPDLQRKHNGSQNMNFLVASWGYGSSDQLILLTPDPLFKVTE
jgi:hypothetical protein